MKVHEERFEEEEETVVCDVCCQEFEPENENDELCSVWVILKSKA